MPRPRSTVDRVCAHVLRGAVTHDSASGDRRVLRVLPGIDGIFLDEMSNNQATRIYYAWLYQYIRGKPGPHAVIGNPGAAAPSAWQLTTPVADAIVVFEGSAAAYAAWSPPSWVRGHVASTISNLVYATPNNANTTGLRELQGQERRLHVRHARRPPESLGHAAGRDVLDQRRRLLSLSQNTIAVTLGRRPPCPPRRPRAAC